MRFRHWISKFLMYVLLYPYAMVVYHRVKIRKFKDKEKRNYFVLMNHQTAFDQFFVAFSIPGRQYIVSSEDLMSNGWISKALRYLIAPIPFKKSTNDFGAVKSCLKIAKEGGTIVMAPEGNRTYDGRLCYIKPTVASLAKAMRLPILLYRIEGGYSVFPRWADKSRKGKMQAYVAKVIEPEEYKDLSEEELFKIITSTLNVDESGVTGEYRSKRRAEYLERVLYVCPSCGLSHFVSKKDRVTCTKCGLELSYGINKEFTLIQGTCSFKLLSEWYDFQNEFVHTLDLTPYQSTTMYSDVVRFSDVIPYERKIHLSKNATVSLYADRFTVSYNNTVLEIPFSKVSAVTVLGKNKLSIYHQGKQYQIKGNKRFNALKYMNIYYHYVNQTTKDSQSKFLGL